LFPKIDNKKNGEDINMNKLKKMWRDRDVYALLYREYIIGFVIGFVIGAIIL